MQAILGQMIVGIFGGIITGFFQFIYLSIFFLSISLFLALGLIINPISVTIYSLFYKRDISYKERYLLINYNWFKYYMIIYVINTIIMILLLDNIYKEYNNITFPLIIIHCISIIIYIPIYNYSRKIFKKPNSQKEKSLNDWEINHKDILEEFKSLKKIEIVEYENKETDIFNNCKKYENQNVIRLASPDIQQTFISICLIYGQYGENWNVISIRINKDMLFIKIELEDKKQKLFTFNKVS